VGATKGEIVIFNVESEKFETRIVIETQIASLDWAGYSGLIAGD